MNQKIKRICALVMLVITTGCATSRHNVGRPISNAGKATGKVGTGILMMAGISIVTIPFAALSIPFYLVACPLYYGGNAIAGDENENGAFEL